MSDAGRFDVPIPPMHPPKQSDHVASILYIADFLTQFTKVLAIKAITFQELCACLHPHTPPNALLDSVSRSSAATTARAAGSTAVGAASKGQVATVGLNGITVTLSNGTVQQKSALGSSVSNCDAAASGRHDERVAAGHEALFELYRGLLQFLLQVTLASGPIGIWLVAGSPVSVIADRRKQAFQTHMLTLVSSTDKGRIPEPLPHSGAAKPAALTTYKDSTACCCIASSHLSALLVSQSHMFSSRAAVDLSNSCQTCLLVQRRLSINT